MFSHRCFTRSTLYYIINKTLINNNIELDASALKNGSQILYSIGFVNHILCMII